MLDRLLPVSINHVVIMEASRPQPGHTTHTHPVLSVGLDRPALAGQRRVVAVERTILGHCLLERLLQSEGGAIQTGQVLHSISDWR